MKFGKTLSSSVYEPWIDQYIDYSKLKLLLREVKDGQSAADPAWTDDDEASFAEELLNVQLEKVKIFQAQKYEEIKSRTSQCEHELECLHLGTDQKLGAESQSASSEEEMKMRELLPQLDSISVEISQLEKFSRINFSGFRKIVKKHDKRRGATYKLRALLSSRLADLPLNTEDYSPLLYRLSAMYSFIRHRLQDERIGQTAGALDARSDDEEYDSATFFVHPEDLLETKTYILRHLPVLVYNPVPNSGVEAPQNDPRLSSIYFDNTSFSLYAERLERRAGASSLRLRWFGQLDETPAIILEQKTVAGQEGSREQRIRLKKKYVAPFLAGAYTLENKISKLRTRGGEYESEANALLSKVEAIQNFVASQKVEPLVCASYNRMAFEVPGDDSIRISIDTDLEFTEGSQENEQLALAAGPSRASASENDRRGVVLSSRSECATSSGFPWAVLTLKLRGDKNKKGPAWVHDLISSHLLREAPKFSKFVHGVATLYEDHVTELPFWINLVDTDIRRDPRVAFEEEQSREEQLIEESQAVGSYGGTPRRKSSLHPHSLRPRHSLSPRRGAFSMVHSTSPTDRHPGSSVELGENAMASQKTHLIRDTKRWLPGIRSVMPAFSSSKYAQSRRQRHLLPPGVKEPEIWIKDSGPVKVEPKVWLANQRTFIKWQHISVLLASLSLALYNSAGRHNTIARGLAIAYFLISLLIAVWGWSMYMLRSHLIRERSGKDLDNILGPIIVCVSLGVALCVNLSLHL